MLKTNKIKLVRKYDFEKLIFLICVTLFGLFVYVLITKNYLEHIGVAGTLQTINVSVIKIN